jgi:DNA-binding NarL/FixJ family response regulator
LKSETQHDDIKCLALLYSAVDESVLKSYDDSISIYDSVEQIAAKLEKLYASETDEVADETSSLSTREKEIVIAVVKGMTNKEIAEQLFLSTHTVISHRRNIARKLEIHSTAGLTIYAIVNKLVELEEIKKNMIL